jgi:hypothetical protein
MSYSHALDDPIAEAEAIRADAEEEDEVAAPRLLQLFLDTDAVYRWYEEDAASEVEGPTLHEAFAAAEEAWESFQLVEFRGEPVAPATDIEDTYAADELEEILGE